MVVPEPSILEYFIINYFIFHILLRHSLVCLEFCVLAGDSKRTSRLSSVGLDSPVLRGPLFLPRAERRRVIKSGRSLLSPRVII